MSYQFEQKHLLYVVTYVMTKCKAKDEISFKELASEHLGERK
jgi:hypothetical protein